LAVSGCPKLKVVNCSDNSLTELGLLNCPKVAEVCFSNNQLEKLQLDGIAETA
jgi:Leucine-rich repeat (LRR) protein